MTGRSDRRARARTAFAIVFATSLTALATSPARAEAEPCPTRRDAPKDDTRIEELRGQFRRGIDLFHERRYAEALEIWNDIYNQLGPELGYRLGFNLGRAYDLSGDLTRAAEHYERYITEVDCRKAGGEALEANVESQKDEAAARLAELRATRGRIRIAKGTRSVFARIDASAWREAGFVAYVTPGAHTVVFRVGESEPRVSVEVEAGAIRDVGPPDLPRESTAPPPRGPTGTRLERPFTPSLLYVAGGVTALSVLLPIVTYTNALSIADEHDTSTDRGTRERLSADYDTAKSNAYASVAVPAVLGAISVGLVVYYFVGSRRVPVTTDPAVGWRGGRPPGRGTVTPSPSGVTLRF